jgi:hypothetical protein
MSTALSVIPREQFTALSNVSGELAEARAAMEAAGEFITAKDRIKVKTPAGGSTTWEIGDTSAKVIEGILVGYQPRGVLWPTEDFDPNSKPVLTTLEPTSKTAVAEQAGPIPDHMLAVLEAHRIDENHFRWADLPYNQWDSGRGGRGKRCKEQREMFILQRGDLYPLRIVAQPGSVKSVSSWFKSLLDQAKVPFWRCVVSLSLVKKDNPDGKPYAMIVPKLVGIVDAETGAMIKKNYTDPLKEIARDLEVAGEPRGDQEGE